MTQEELAARVAAVGAAGFEPVVLAAIDLDQLAERGSAKTGLVRHWRPILARGPQTDGPHPVPERLPGDDQVVQLAELLGRQGGPEVGVQVSDKRQCALLDVCWLPSVARPASLLRRFPRIRRGQEGCRRPACTRKTWFPDRSTAPGCSWQPPPEVTIPPRRRLVAGGRCAALTTTSQART